MQFAAALQPRQPPQLHGHKYPLTASKLRLLVMGVPKPKKKSTSRKPWESPSMIS